MTEVLLRHFYYGRSLYNYLLLLLLLLLLNCTGLLLFLVKAYTVQTLLYFVITHCDFIS